MRQRDRTQGRGDCEIAAYLKDDTSFQWRNGPSTQLALLELRDSGAQGSRTILQLSQQRWSSRGPSSESGRLEGGGVSGPAVNLLEYSMSRRAVSHPGGTAGQRAKESERLEQSGRY
ncbi:hypothetical protein AAFF_G00399140 [Aldrovandia affinis]|uniref:Uncharacterized protein n=1 Tax=Aldrovandia affinis TaxID=143900 RepID=A0AAD7SCQ8_9TELE|nr:hypothetical protein AAFF_G00399140 [Aldrovandia affinis]